MRIGLTVDPLATPLTGIGRYTYALATGLSARSEIEDLRFFDGIGWRKNLPAAGQLLRRPRGRWMRKWKAFAARPVFEGRLVHGTNYFLPPRTDVGVVTVHDLSIFLYPESHPVERIQSFERQFLSSLVRASHVITDSDTVGAELISHFSVPRDRVHTVNLGVSEAFHPRPLHEMTTQLRQILGREVQDYVLCVATLEPRKRIEAAIRAHVAMCERTKRDILLVLVGASGWKNEELLRLIDIEKTKGRLISLGYVPEEHLPILYAAARLFVYPSIYEGFGLPPIEAMRSGVPTIVANRSCLPEVTRGGALLTDPDDLEAFSRDLEGLFFDEGLREKLKIRGLSVSAEYSWEACVEGTLAVYRDAIRAIA